MIPLYPTPGLDLLARGEYERAKRDAFSVEYHADFTEFFASVAKVQYMLCNPEEYYRHFNRCIRFAKALRHKKRGHYHVKYRPRKRRSRQ